MAESQSYIFDFTKTDRFLRDINRTTCFDTADMDGESLNYRFVLATSLPSKNFNECIDNDGSLKNSVIVYNADSEEGVCSLLYSDGVNGDATISVSSGQISYDIGDDDVMVEAIFLVDDNTSYVIAYCILNAPVPVVNQVILPVTGVLWNIKNEV